MWGMLKNHCTKLLHCLLTESFLVFCEPTQLFLSLRASFTDRKKITFSAKHHNQTLNYLFQYLLFLFLTRRFIFRNFPIRGT